MFKKSMQFLHRISYALSIILASFIHFWLNRPRGSEHNVSIFIDKLIPFSEWFSIPYLYWFAYIFLVIIYLSLVDYKSYFRLVASIVFGMCVSFLFFIFYPTTVARVDVLEEGFWGFLMGLIYGNDNPYNCFPSIHVLNAFLATAFLCKSNRRFFIRSFAVISCILISLSTMFVKQHYVLDVVAAFVIGIVLYILFSSDRIWNNEKIKRITGFKAPARVKNGNVGMN
jgi:membrane-associated phospholipid phosphatase